MKKNLPFVIGFCILLSPICLLINVFLCLKFSQYEMYSLFWLFFGISFVNFFLIISIVSDIMVYNIWFRDIGGPAIQVYGYKHRYVLLLCNKAITFPKLSKFKLGLKENDLEKRMKHTCLRDPLCPVIFSFFSLFNVYPRLYKIRKLETKNGVDFYGGEVKYVNSNLYGKQCILNYCKVEEL